MKCFNLDYPSVIDKHCYEAIRCCNELAERCPLDKAMREAGKYENIELSVEIGNRLRTFLVSGSFLEDISGKFAGGVQLYIDVTEAKENERKLLKAKEEAALETAKLRAMISGMGEGVVFADANDVITEVNDFFSNLNGLPREALIGKSFWKFHEGELIEKVKILIDSYKNGSRSSNVTMTRRIKDMDLILRVQPIYSNGLYQGVLLNVIDVTELTRAREEAERAKELAESANRAKSDFLANMSHEIRTPMNGILGFAEILLNQGLTDEQRESVQAISLCGEQLLELINDILDLSKIESGKMVLEEDEFNLENLLKEAITTVRQKAHEKGLQIKVEFQKTMPKKFLGDQIRLRQVLANLIANAVKFTPEGSVTVAISRGNGECLNEDIFPLTIEVKDTGIGVPFAKRDLIFQAFAQAERDTARKFGGTGLGLTISRSLVELMGGEIWVKSNVPRGSVFAFCLPVKILKEDDYNGHDFYKGPPVNRPTILVVEDDWVGSQVIEIHLQKAGYNVISTTSGHEAILFAERFRPHAVILDLLLPDMSGWEVLQELKRSENTQDIPVIICSILTDKEKAISLGAVDYLKKPVREKSLLEKVRRFASMQSCTDCHVVLVDDEQSVLDYLGAVFSEIDYVIHPFTDSKDALIYLLTGGEAHAIVLDLLMPGMDGFEFLNRLRANQQTAKIPVLIYTAKTLTNQDYDKLSNKCQLVLEKSLVKPSMLVEELSQLVSEFAAPIYPAVPETVKEPAYRILVAEDNPMNQKLIETFLLSEGHTVMVVNDGSEVMTALEEGDFDLILMDMQMPIMDGYETTARIRAEEEWESMPVIALTAYAMKGDEDKCLKAGCNFYLSKPVKRDKLFSAINRVMGEQPPPKAASVEKSQSPAEIEYLIPFFVKSVENEILKARQALEKMEFKALHYIGHGLKGACGAYGYFKLSELGAAIESAAGIGDVESIATLLDKVESEIKKIKLTG